VALEKPSLNSVQLKILDPRIGTEFPLPSHATAGSAGFDLRACTDATLELAAGAVELIPTGFALYIADPGLAGMLLPRSGLGHKHGVYTVEPGDRIAQLVIVPVVQTAFEVVEEFVTTDRGGSGFGSSGSR